MEIQDIMRELANNGVSTSIHFNKKKDQCYIDLETMAKSHLYLYEDGMLYGRYNYERKMDLNEDMDILITQLCVEFKNALHGRPYYQDAWAELCRMKNINI